MSHELATLFAAGFLYLLVLFLIAYATDRGYRKLGDPSAAAAGRRRLRHPRGPTTAASVCGHNGLLFLTIIGATLAFVLSPVLRDRSCG